MFCLLLSFLFYSPPLRSSFLVEEEEGEKWGRRNERNVASLNGVCGLDREDLNLRIEGGGGGFLIHVVGENSSISLIDRSINNGWRYRLRRGEKEKYV